MIRQRAFPVLSMICLLAACQPSAPEEAIREAIARTEQAIENHDAGDAVAALAEHFDGNGRFDRQGVRRLLAVQFLTHQSIHVLLSNVDIRVDGERASMSATAVATGGQGLIPEDGRIWRLKGRWELIDGDWLLSYLEWK